MKLTQEFKRMWNALTYSTAGRENLTPKPMHRVIVGGVAPCPVIEATSRPKATQIGLYLGSELPADVMQHTIQKCSELKYGLCVFTFQSELDARALLKPYQSELEDARIGVQLTVLVGEPPAALVQALRKRPDIACLLCNASGYLGRSLMRGVVREETFPVPVVRVAAHESAMTAPSQAVSSPAVGRAA